MAIIAQPSSFGVGKNNNYPADCFIYSVFNLHTAYLDARCNGSVITQSTEIVCILMWLNSSNTNMF